MKETEPRPTCNDTLCAAVVLLRRAAATDLAPVRKRVETRREGQLLLAGAVRIDQKELELTKSSHTSVEHDLLAIG